MRTPGAFETPARAVWRLFAFFTVLTNRIAALAGTASAFALGSAARWIARSTNVRAAALLLTATVGIVFHLLLIDDQLRHTARPLMVLIGWLALEERRGLSFRALPTYLVYADGYTL